MLMPFLKLPLLVGAAVLCIGLAAFLSPAAAKTGPHAQAPGPLSLEALNGASLVPGQGKGATGVNAVVRAQVLLDRGWFSPGEIDGRQGRNLQRAVTAFQMANGMKVTDRLDAAVAQALEEGDKGAAFTTYAITGKDAAGPYTTTPAAMADRAKLKRLDYGNIREALAERFHVSEAMLV
jgi:peptidoglycan hydrolase-like protein with peptidoglycan-binding domain